MKEKEEIEKESSNDEKEEEEEKKRGRGEERKIIDQSRYCNVTFVTRVKDFFLFPNFPIRFFLSHSLSLSKHFALVIHKKRIFSFVESVSDCCFVASFHISQELCSAKKRK